MKSITRRPSEYLPVAWWKKVRPKGGRAERGFSSGRLCRSGLPVSASESPKLIMESKHPKADSLQLADDNCESKEINVIAYATAIFVEQVP